MATFEFTKIRVARRERKISAEKLANRVGLTRFTLDKYEKGLTQPTAGTLTRIAEELQVPITYFFTCEY